MPHQTDTPRTLRTAAALAAAGLVDDAEPLAPVLDEFALAITPAMADLIDPGDPDDPIAAQFVPRVAELRVLPVELADPIGDAPFTPTPGITHRYPDRVLLKPLHTCPVYCRFCFRREKVGPGGEALAQKELEAALDYVRERPEVWEVILTGGDPLLLAPRLLGRILQQLDAIPHVQVIRIHTRVPVVDPRRISAALLDVLRRETPVFVVLHCNHARELTDDAARACAALVDRGVPMLSQSVLLRGVNDSVEALEALLRRLVTLRVKPYYLHHTDLARGTGHFRVDIETGQRLVAALRGRLSGLCQPTYVLDLPGGHGKVPIGPVYLEQRTEDGRWRIRDPRGTLHTYPPSIP